MEEYEQTNGELSQEELQEVTGGDGQTGAIVGTGLAGSAVVAGAVGAGAYHVGKKVDQLGHIAKGLGLLGVATGREIRATKEATQVGTYHLGNIVERLPHG